MALVLFCSFARASRILFYTCPGCTSHQFEMLAISDELQKRGHETKHLLPNWDLELMLGPKLPPTHNASFIVHHPYKDVYEGRRRFDTQVKNIEVKTVKVRGMRLTSSEPRRRWQRNSQGRFPGSQTRCCDMSWSHLHPRRMSK